MLREELRIGGLRSNRRLSHRSKMLGRSSTLILLFSKRILLSPRSKMLRTRSLKRLRNTQPHTKPPSEEDEGAPPPPPPPPAAPPSASEWLSE